MGLFLTMTPTPDSFAFPALMGIWTPAGGSQGRIGRLQRRCNGVPQAAQTPNRAPAAHQEADHG